MDDSCISFDTGLQKLIQSKDVNIAKEDFIFGFPHQERTFHGSMSCEKSLGFLLELLWAYFFSTNSFRDDHWSASNFSKSLGKNLRVDNVPLDNLDVIVWPECFVELARVYILSSPNQQSIFIKGEFDDTDAVGFSYSSHKVTESGVKRTPSTRCNQIGRMPSSNDLFDKDPIGFWNLEGIDCMFFQMSSNSIRNCIGEAVCFP